MIVIGWRGGSARTGAQTLQWPQSMANEMLPSHPMMIIMMIMRWWWLALYCQSPVGQSDLFVAVVVAPWLQWNMAKLMAKTSTVQVMTNGTLRFVTVNNNGQNHFITSAPSLFRKWPITVPLPVNPLSVCYTTQTLLHLNQHHILAFWFYQKINSFNENASKRIFL